MPRFKDKRRCHSGAAADRMRRMSKILPRTTPGGCTPGTGHAKWAVLRGARCLQLALFCALMTQVATLQAAESDDNANPATPTVNPTVNEFASCPPLLPLSAEQESRISQPYDPDAPTTLEADKGTFVEEGFSVLDGNVVYSQSSRWLNSEHLEYNAATGELRSDTPTRFLSGQLGFDSESINYNTQLQTGELGKAEFYLFGRHARGDADKVVIKSDSQASLDGITFTTCPAGDEDWYLRATELELDQEEGVGVARHMRVAFMDVPFFYLPWVSFPINDQRKSGFLFPEIGNSSTRGTFLRVPYYLNIAPNYDATLAPYYMSKRGTLLDGEFRYLTGIGKGTLDFEYLENDRVTETTRYRGQLQHSAALGAGWAAGLNYNTISDPAYLEDLSDSGRATEISWLAQTAYVSKAGLDYALRISAKDFEQVDPTRSAANAPYSEMPSLEFEYRPLPLLGRIEPAVSVDATEFQQDFRIDGTRQHLQPELALNLGTAAILVRPSISHWQTDYELEQLDGSPLEIDRSVTIKSMDLGLVLERAMADGGIQTLEPRLYYLDVPYVEQANIPLFDTREASATLDQLFRPNRFSGIDRIGDTRQISAGIGSRFMEAGSGRTWLELEIARARYFEDRLVTLRASDSPETSTESDVFAAVHYAPTEKLDLRLDASVEPGSGKLGIATMRFGYAASERAELNFSYSFRRDTPASPALPDEPLEQAAISFLAPVGSRWDLFGKAVYSLPEERSLETMAGFEYESCCWAFRVFQRRYIRNRAGEVDSSLWFQLELKGLANVGRGVLDFLGNEFQAYGEPE